MKKLFTLIFILFSFFAQADYWTQKADFGGTGRYGAVGFSISAKGYIGTGGDPFLKDFWEYDPSTNIWTQKADFGGTGRYGAVGFSIGNKGYIGTGWQMGGCCKDFWEYDPVTNLWTQKADYGGISRFVATGFSIGNKGYIGIGNDIAGNFLSDFWEYDPLNNSWIQKMNFAGLERSIAAGFSNGVKGYIGTGTDSSTHPLGKNDFWEWNPSTNVWTQKANFGGTARSEACAFWLCPYGYIGLGTSLIGSGTVSDFWKYNSANNSWTQATNFGNGLREMAVAFSIGNKGYVGTGFINDIGSTYKNDFWEYTPDSACATGIEELTINNFQFTISPKPAKDYIVINIPGFKNLEYLTITDIAGKKVYESKPLSSNFQLPTSNFQKGIYFVEVTNGKEKTVKKFLKQ